MHSYLLGRGAHFFFGIVALFLVTSPSLSIFKVLGGSFYFPNEKLALVLVSLFLLLEGWREIFNSNQRRVLCAALTMTVFILMRSVLWSDGHIRDLNLPASMVSITFLYLYFNKYRDSAYKSLFVVLCIHLGVSIFQLLCVYFKEPQLAMLFHNHPMQSNYYFSWRVSGLFMESSQFASFLALGFFTILNKRKRLLDFVVLFVTLTIFIFNKSITGYLIFILWMILHSKGARLALVGLGFMLLLDYFFIGVFKGPLNEIYQKIYITFFDFEKVTGEVRFIDARDALSSWARELKSVLFGVESRDTLQIGDVLSYNLYRFGLVGITLIFYFYKTFIGELRSRWIILAPLLLTCAPIMQPIQMVYLVFLKLSLGSRKKD